MYTKSLILIASSVIALGQTNVQLVEPETANEILRSGTSATTNGYSPITTGQRFRWVVDGSVGPADLAGTALTAAWGTLTNSPKEYGTHWSGYGKRYGLGLAGSGTSQVMEASIGSLWGEDPRYFRAAGQPFKNRLGHVLKMTVTATNRDGHAMPAYSRYIAYTGTSFISNAWRPDSQATVDEALGRIPLSFASTLAGRAFAEFWPDIRERILGK
jgi:hypothetical protein